MSNLEEWRESQKHIPEFMRDFHDAKDLFKALAELMQHDEEKEMYLRGLNAQNTHIFVVDYFLWIMAAHGYTMQRSRTKFDFRDIEVFIKTCKDRRAEMFSKMLNEATKPKP